MESYIHCFNIKEIPTGKEVFFMLRFAIDPDYSLTKLPTRFGEISIRNAKGDVY